MDVHSIAIDIICDPVEKPSAARVIRKYLDEACKRQPEFWDTDHAVMAASLVGWPVLIWRDSEMVAGAMLMRINQALHVALIGGKHMEDWISDLTDAVSGHAAMIGSKYVIAAGRPGWQKVLQPLGYKFSTVTLIKEVA